jgi:nucleotide-binding universal stress UspA family protein
MRAPIIVGVDPLERAAALEALALGRALSHLLGDPLQAVHVFAPQGADPVVERRRHEQEIVRLLDDARVAAAVTAFPGLSPARVMHHLADRERASGVVIGSAHEAQPGRTSLGPVSEALLFGSRVPVVVAPGGYVPPEGGIERVAVAYGGTPESDEALRHAAALAGDHRLTVLAADDPAPAATARERLDRALARAGHEAEGVVVEGGPASGLVAASAELDLLIAGSRSYGPLRVVLLGAVTRRLLATARCPVMLVPRLPDIAHDGPLVGGMEVALET